MSPTEFVVQFLYLVLQLPHGILPVVPFLIELVRHPPQIVVVVFVRYRARNSLIENFLKEQFQIPVPSALMIVDVISLWTSFPRSVNQVPIFDISVGVSLFQVSLKERSVEECFLTVWAPMVGVRSAVHDLLLGQDELFPTMTFTLEVAYVCLVLL